MIVTSVFKYVAIFAALAAISGSALAQNQQLVDFEHLGGPLNTKKMGSKEKLTLKKLDISEDSYYGIGSGARVVAINGGSGYFVLSQSCEASANGSSDGCELDTIASLDNGKKFSLPNSQPFKTSFRDSTGSTGVTKYLQNEKGELLALVYVGNYVKKFKGKEACDNKGAVLDLDPKGMKLAVRFAGKALGKECYAPSKQAQTGAGSDQDAFYDKLITKTLAN